MSNRAWLYYRLSRDDDANKTSLKNQRKILVDYADTYDLVVVGESFDDNVSGMHYERKGIDQLDEAVENGQIDIVLVKDFSRLGRHKLLTALYIEKLHSFGIRVISVSENLDSLNADNDLIIGVKQLLNEQYSKDLSRKINAGLERKFKEGLVIHTPYGYFKNKNTNSIKIVSSEAVIIRSIFQMFTDGGNVNDIAKFLTTCNLPTPRSSKNSQNVQQPWHICLNFPSKMGKSSKKMNDITR